VERFLNTPRSLKSGHGGEGDSLSTHLPSSSKACDLLLQPSAFA
jgi:hypothetical protein